MATKKEYIFELYHQTVSDITAGAEEWKSFLRSACRNYKCRFDEQVLIYAQKPEATAVLELERWNRMYGRWVNKGTKGIAVFDSAADRRSRLNHYFDISDTHESRNSKLVAIWEMEDVYTDGIIETLENSFGGLDDKSTLPMAIVSAAENAVTDNISDYITEMERGPSGSRLFRLSEDERRHAFTVTVKSGMVYMILARLGIAPETFVPGEAFEYLHLFDTTGAANFLGYATSDIAEMALREISSTVLACEKNIRTFETAQTPVHNEEKETAESAPDRSKENGQAEINGAGVERSDGNGTDLHAEGRLSLSRPDGAGGTAPREVRQDEGGLPEKAQEGDILQPAHAGDTGSAPSGDSGDGNAQDGSSHGADGGADGSDRKSESIRPDEMGRADGEHPPLGGGEHSERADIRLGEETGGRQQDTETEGESLPFFIGEKPDKGRLTSAMPTVTTEQLSLFDTDRPSTKYDCLIGEELEEGGRRYRVDSINGIDVTLADITFQDDTGIPVSRIAKIGAVNHWYNRTKHWAKQDEEKPEPEQAREPALSPAAVNRNFRITDDDLGCGGAKAKFTANINAIETLHKIEADGRLADLEEQETLSGYAGWGSLSGVFNENNHEWHDGHLMLKEILSDEEFESARATTLNAYYTSPAIIKAMYKAVESMGFSGGNILEPSCGTGNFMGLIPESMGDSKVYGVELDSLTGRIARQLYPNNDIQIKGFEETDFGDSFFDIAIGNIPFGSYGIFDSRYQKHGFLVHDYFFAKAIDKVRPGGIIAFVTSKGTMDKQNPAVRKYIAQRAELIGAIRLPNNAFMANAGTGVTADIVFLQKRDRIIDIEPDWIHLGQTESGIPVNSYFAENPDMILGEMSFENMMYGNEKNTACNPFPDSNLSEQLENAIANIHAEILEYERDDESEEDLSIPADPAVRNFSYTLVGGEIYYRENSKMSPAGLSVTGANRVRGMIAIRDSVRRLIEYQTENYPDEDISDEQRDLNRLYDSYTNKYGLLCARANSMAFSEDSSYPLLCSLEIIDAGGNLKRKADMFSKRTIKPHSKVTSVDTASEALAVSIGEKAAVDIDFMAKLTGKPPLELYDELKGVIYYDTSGGGEPSFKTADEFLSGNIRQKLRDQERRLNSLENRLEATGDSRDDYGIPNGIENCKFNIAALENIMPEDLPAAEISVRLGSTWIPPEYINDFMYEILETPVHARRHVRVHYSGHAAIWNVEGKSFDRTNLAANSKYGTSRINAYKIIEETLNLKDVRIFDYIYDDNGNKTAVLNKKETTIARNKQEQIKDAFTGWLWEEPERRERLVRLYNDTFNSIRTREYDGGHITFSGINPAIELYGHQKNAIARILYGGNTLLAHVVGAGKTFEMAAAAMEGKRLGLCSKSLFVVPNHLTEQWAGEFLQLYPSASILVTTKKDFEMKNRRKFCSRISTGDYDAVIIGHSQFEKIPMSTQRQEQQIKNQISDIQLGINEMKQQNGERFSIKQMEQSKKMLKVKLKKLNDQSRKDDVVTFEQLGVDRLFVDEAHYYKNLFLYTKMRNVGGIARVEAQKSSDLFMKCRYLDGITHNRGTVFATGTPISNSMAEMYTMQRYLQYDMLTEYGLQHFDSWASTFGETVTTVELAPEGTGYRMKTRFAKFFNLPELMAMFRQTADIKTADMLNLPVPKANYHNIALPPSEIQKEMVAALSERADRVRNKAVPPQTDNMLLITNDGRKLALDERLMNGMLPGTDEGKVAVCADNIYRIWAGTKENRLAQLAFCDLSTPKNDGNFNVYDEIRRRLTERGVPENEIAFIHSANTDTQKKEMFAKVRTGNIRVLLGSTAKMGAGTNVQDRLIALHDLDCPWRPSDLEQRSGRIIRQGNSNPEVDIYRYVTEQTFDAYLYQIIENKQKFIGQIMTSKSPVRSADDIDETALSYAEIKALATGNPHIKEKMDLDIEVARLKVLRSGFQEQKYDLQDNLMKVYPAQIEHQSELIKGYGTDITHLEKNTPMDKDVFPPMEIGSRIYKDKAGAGQEILLACSRTSSTDPVPVGSYRGFTMELRFDAFDKEYVLYLKNALTHKVKLGNDISGNITRINNVLDGMAGKLDETKEKLANTRQQMENAEIEIKKGFPQEAELARKTERLTELNGILNMDEKDTGAAELDEDLPEQDAEERSARER